LPAATALFLPYGKSALSTQVVIASSQANQKIRILTAGDFLNFVEQCSNYSKVDFKNNLLYLYMG